jgi:K+/H+ antiporter YhaU regulatory subunit KhtT
MSGPLNMVIDWTITAGNMIEIATIAGGGVWALIKMNSTLGTLKTEVATMQEEIKKIGDVLTKLAVTENRLTNIETDIRELRARQLHFHPADTN